MSYGQSARQATFRDRDQFLFLLETFLRQLQVCFFVAPSLTRRTVCNLLFLLSMASAVFLGLSPAGLKTLTSWYMYVCIYIYTYMCVCIYIYIYIYIYSERKREKVRRGIENHYIRGGGRKDLFGLLGSRAVPASRSVWGKAHDQN
jgi:hypothetical protein